MLNKLLTAVVASSIMLSAPLALAADVDAGAPAAAVDHKDCKAMKGAEKRACMKDMKKAHAEKKMTTEKKVEKKTETKEEKKEETK